MKKLILLLMAVAVGLFGAEAKKSGTIEVNGTIGASTVTKLEKPTSKIKEGLILPYANNVMVTAAKTGGGIYDISQFPPFDDETDEGIEVQSNGQTLFYIIYTKPVGNTIDVGDLAPAQAISSSVSDFYEKTRTGTPGHVWEYYNTVVTNSNSFGGWVYFDSANGGYGGGCTLASRSTTKNVFNFRLNTNGTLSIIAQVTDWSVDGPMTTNPVPMDEWVYIQGYQYGNTYKVGWKKADGTQHIVQKNVVPLGGPYSPNQYSFPLNCITKARSLFWQPGDNMFVNMYSNVSGKEIYQKGAYYFTSSNQISNDVYNAILYYGQPIEPINSSMFDVYLINNQYIWYVDLRE